MSKLDSENIKTILPFSVSLVEKQQTRLVRPAANAMMTMRCANRASDTKSAWMLAWI
jgi:hypothetical protein